VLSLKVSAFFSNRSLKLHAPLSDGRINDRPVIGGDSTIQQYALATRRHLECYICNYCKLSLALYSIFCSSPGWVMKSAKILFNIFHFPGRYRRKREWVFLEYSVENIKRLFKCFVWIGTHKISRVSPTVVPHVQNALYFRQKVRAL